MAGKFPESYVDPLYSSLDSATEQKLKLPVGLLSSIRTAGEKTNASQVSEAGATTPYQFIPATRKAILDKYGIDVTLSPENASQGAGLLLQESLKRAKGDTERAVREYHGGTNPKNWGKVNEAYAGRVLTAQGKSKMAALSSGFAAFMKDNPAAPAQAEPEAPKDDPLARGFGEWLKVGAQKPSDMIPNEHGPAPALTPQADSSLVDRIVGTGEAALTLATGATGGTVGMIGGAVKGLAGSVMDGTFGTQEGVKQVEQSAGEGMSALTYQPRTQSGQDQVAAVGEVAAVAVPATGLAGELSAIGRGTAGAAQAARNTVIPQVTQAANNTVTRIRSVAPQIADRIERTIRRNPDRPTAGTRGSVGAAGTDAARQRGEVANDLPAPIPLTEGQATRDPGQLRFELETAKGEQGAPLRERYAEQNERIQKNFDAFVDMTGAESPDLRTTGKTVDGAIRAKAARDKAEIRVAYKEAEKAGELEAPVTLDELVDHLNESAPDAATAPILNTARARAIQLGIAAEDGDGNLIAQATTLKNAERMRQAINRATDYEPTNIRQSAIIKGAIDSHTEGLGGGKYKAARQLRERYGRQYENRAVINDLLRTAKNGSQDRKVAFEDVFDSIVLKSDYDDLRHAGKVLKTGGEEGQQAWKEIQGRTAQWLKDEATKNVATDQRGNRIFSAAQLDKAIRKLDHDGKLDYIFGKKGASTMRDINDLAKVVFTAPPGVVNTSNTASVLMAALAEAGVTGSMLGLPVPVVSGLRLASKHIKDRKLRARIEHALNAPQRRRQPQPQ